MNEKEINLTDMGPPIQGEIPGLRDFFATSALTVFSGSMWCNAPEVIAEYCYDVADAMMKEKNVRQKRISETIQKKQ